MTKNFVTGGCSFTYGSELSDSGSSKHSEKSWAHGLYRNHTVTTNFVCAAKPGLGNQGIARRVFNAVANAGPVECVVVMWTFLSRYDWAMPRHRSLEDTRWTTISPWDTDTGNEEAFRTLTGSEVQQEEWKTRRQEFIDSGVRDLAEAVYRHGANQYHETYLSWKSIIWLQNILEKKKIPYMFTLADNSLFYQEFEQHKDQDGLMSALHSEIDFTKWFFFGERCMGFNQWALLNEYERGTTHPLDKAHEDAIMLMQPEFDKIIGGQK